MCPGVCVNDANLILELLVAGDDVREKEGE
jgi:hypothetical protein